MAIAATTAVRLRIRGDSLDPEDVTRLLGAQPDLAAKQGGTFYSPKGRPMFASTGFWHFGVERSSPGNLDGQIVNLLSALSQDLAVWQGLARRFHIELFCGMMMERSNEVTGLQAATMLAMAQRGLSFELDVYGPPFDDDEESWVSDPKSPSSVAET